MCVSMRTWCFALFLPVIHSFVCLYGSCTCMCVCVCLSVHCIFPYALQVMSGRHGTVFAYGATGSGKTYTMSGTGVQNAGLMYYTIFDLFAQIGERYRWHTDARMYLAPSFFAKCRLKYVSTKDARPYTTRIYVYIKLIHFAVQQTLIQHSL